MKQALYHLFNLSTAACVTCLTHVLPCCPITADWSTISGCTITMSTTTQLLSPKTALPVSTSSLPLRSKPDLLPAIKESLADVPIAPSRPPVSQVLDKDKETPDNHVTRDSRLIRLTGVHPFNAEAPLTALYREGKMKLALTFCSRLFHPGVWRKKLTQTNVMSRLHHIG